jgi:bifunctional pyridoxal-dependent enzyme with beta-cystathionase and maltose regulon repressor activities
MARSRSAMNLERDDAPIRGARLAPVRTVRRVLVSPSGSQVVVDVPVYPPFRLASDEERKLALAAQAATNGSTPAGDPGADLAADLDADPPDPETAA